MASASSSQPNHTRFDVFLSFRGEDTRYAFTDHLYEALRQAGIVAFRDNDDIDRGEELTPRIEKGIKESKASIVVLSENYAKSKWCLHELLLILEQRQNFSHFVLPVLYHVDPSDVRNQRRSFLIEADDRVEGSKWTWVNVNRWKSALTEVANLAGMVAEGLETDFIKDIVDTINRKLNLKLVGTPAHLTAMETRAKHINSFLDNKEPGDNVLAIYGMGGAGKTTLAQYIYNANKQKFERSSFLLDIGLEKKQPYGLLNLKTQLINDMLGSNNTRIRLNNVYEDMHRIEEALIRKRVLIVLDDIDDNEQLNVLLGNGRAHAISKIIITTRNQEIQSWFKSKNQRCNMYGINKLNDGDSLELLSRHAFGSRKPMEGFEDVAAQLAQYCGGNPLALEVLGSSLYTNAEDMQGRTDMLETWRSTLNSLNSSKGDIHFKIQYVLKRSYDSLPYESQKALFLHIACFFVGEYKDYVAPILEPDWHAISGITNLINRCLITISPGNKLIMHQLLQEMARSIVIGESRVPATRSIVWEMSDSHELLRSKEGSETIEGLALDMRERRQNTTYDTQEDRQSTTYMILDFQNYRQRKLDAGKTSSLSKMKKLKLLRLIDVRLNGNYKKIPELRWLCRHKCYLKKIPSGLFMRSLVAIDMSNGECKTFKPPVVLDLLKILNLKGSHKLVGIHSLHKLPNLESLILWDCSSLTHLSKRIGSLKRLALLDLTGCKKLLISVGCYPCFGEENQRRLIFSLPASLKLLLLNDFLPEDGIEDSIDVRVLQNNQPQPFLYINLGNSQFEFLPKFVDNFKLRVLDLTCCPNLESLMSLPSTLEELYTYRCTSLKKITFQSARFSLRKFGYGGCSKLSEIQGLFKLVLIKELDEMLYEYGIRSTFLPKDQSMSMPENMNFSPFFSFHVAPRNGRTFDGLLLTSLYRSSGEDAADMPVLFAKITNKTKGLTWIYNPVVFGKPKVGEDVVWLSYWPNRNMVDFGDEVDISIIGGNGLMVTGVAAQYLYGIAEQENSENYTQEVEVIGGNLSDFELTRGAYYLCRRDFFKSTAPDWLKMLIGDTFDYTELQGWRKTRQTFDDESFMGLQTFRGNRCGVNEIIPRLLWADADPVIPERLEDRPDTMSGYSSVTIKSSSFSWNS